MKAARRSAMLAPAAQIGMHSSILKSVVLPLFLLVQLFGQSDSNPSLTGFDSAASKTELEWEAKFRLVPDPKQIQTNMRFLAAHPHNVGSAAQKRNAEWLVERYKEWGWDAHIERFDVLYPTPTARVLELVGPGHFKARLEEPPLPGDPYTTERTTQLPGFNIYSADGDVTAPLVYVNYGMPNDYEELARNNISVKGAIVIARYGGGWRGLKPKLAHEHGAVGCIIYSDPADDGYAQGAVLPKGPMRPPAGIQRGSVADATLYSGDPLTPGVASVPGAKRLAISESPTIMKIPVIPIGYADAQPLLAALGGRDVPPAWRGALPMTYHFGPGPAKVHLQLKFNWEQKPVLDVIATLKGNEEPDVWIVRGNHYDAWVNGAADPISGQAALLEEARALGSLYKEGWRPRRTLVYAAWDGEEPGLIGSTEWVEAHADELSQKVAAYINTDDSGRGFFQAGGSHSLETLTNEVVKAIPDPEAGVSVWERAQASRLLGTGRRGSRKGPNTSKGVEFPAVLPIEAIGSGSDFGPFLDHLGIASLSIGYGGEDRSGTYHSAYDTPWFEEHFGDKDETYGRVLALTAGTLVLRLSDSPVLPFRFGSLAKTLHGYVSEAEGELKSLQEAAKVRDEETQMNLYKLVDDPQKKLLPPPELKSPPNLDFSSLDKAVQTLQASADKFDKTTAKLLTLPADQARELNAQLAVAERRLTSADGLPGRSWMRHLLYAPGTYSGYGAKTLPGVTEAIEAGRYEEAEQQITVLAKAVDDEAEYLNALAKRFTH
jgi:N-acetylated-alpha-linked acidic dipeptidase